MPPLMPPRRPTWNDGIEKPKRLRDVPRFVYLRIKGFFSRLGTIVGLVWRSAPICLCLMLFFCLAEGFLPVVGAYISRDLLNAIADMLGTELSAPMDALSAMVGEKDAPESIAQGVFDILHLPKDGEELIVDVPLGRPNSGNIVGTITLALRG